MPLASILIRLDGLYGTTAVLTPLLSSGMGVIVRSKEYGLLDLPAVAARLTLPPDAQTTHPESGAQRALFDCPDLALLPGGPRVRLIVATHPATSTAKPPIGVLRAGTVYELFLTTAPQTAFTCADVLGLYLHRGSFESVLAHADQEQDTDRWCSHTPCGQEFWQIVNQWLWNLRLEFGQHLSPTPMRLTEFAPAHQEAAGAVSELARQEEAAGVVAEPAHQATAVTASEPLLSGPPQWAHRSFTKGFAGADFTLQPDGTLRCPADHPLTVQERRPERNGSVRMVYGARITHCRPCPLREQCQESTTTKKPRQVSAVVWPVEASTPTLAQLSAHPVAVSSEQRSSPPPELPAPHPVLWGDWPRCHLRRQWMRVLRTQTVTLTSGSAQQEEKREVEAQHTQVQTRAQRAHWRLSWHERMARNARLSTASPLEVTIHGLPAAFAQSFGLNVVTAA